jgi:DNA-binding response OmpR family regulator
MNQPERILVVEDDPEICSLLCELLRVDGYRADAAPDGSDAIRQIKEDRPDAVVLDVMLPDMSGFDVCQRLKLRRETNQIPILMLTALHDEASRRSGLRVGANRYLTKPFEPEQLLRELRQAFDHRRELLDRQAHTSVQVQMASDTRHREQLNDLLSELFVLTPLSEEEIDRIRYAVLEMTENAAEWGNKRQKDLIVSISYEVTDEHVRFIIKDEGPGFDPTCLPHAACTDDPTAHMSIREKLGLRDGGFGIMLTRAMVDKVEYNQAGNQVTLTKYINGARLTA